jgi:hypothetical protein
MDAAAIRRQIGFFFLFILLTTASYATPPLPLPQIIGQVVWAKGTLKGTLPNAEARTLARRSAVYEHDTLMTDPTSTGEIVFTDDSVLTLREDSTVQIDKYKYGKGKAPNEDTFAINVVKGGFRTITGAISKNNPGGYVATTPVANIGVSGTAYSVYYNPAKKDMAAKLDKGGIVVSNSKGKVNLTKCPPGQKKGDAGSGCVDSVYAQVGENAAPQAVAQQPAAFNSEPPITATEYPKPSGEISSFCIN